MKTITMGEIVRAVDEQCDGHYPMGLVGCDRKVVTNAVNVGIDAHLQACNVPDRGDSYADDGHRLHCRVSGESLAVLLRRLTDGTTIGQSDEDSDQASSLACGIMDTLGFGVDCMEFDINTD
jgi:hypothetical protein